MAAARTVGELVVMADVRGVATWSVELVVTAASTPAALVEAPSAPNRSKADEISGEAPSRWTGFPHCLANVAESWTMTKYDSEWVTSGVFCRMQVPHAPSCDWKGPSHRQEIAADSDDSAS